VYIAIGAIAGGVALGVAERPGGAHRAMLLIERLPLGRVILVALGIGFVGYAALNLAGAIRDQEQRGLSPSGLLMRTADALTGAMYLALALAAVRIAAAPVREGGRLVEAGAAHVLRLPGGAILLGGAGITLLAAGAFLAHRARSERFEDLLDRRSLSERARRLITGAARFGTLARGVVFAICGLLAIEAALTRQPGRVGDIGDALSTVETTPAGSGALAMVALGFMAYGAYQLAKVRYRRVPIR
jgi:tetrahydromethanopterin S-methyltransferase subunit F